jgi:HNH endonuclease
VGINVGRKTRRVSTALLRALKARDQPCQFPGCDKIGNLTPHHVTHWAAGGATDQDNLCLLHRAEGLEIRPETNVIGWHGERLKQCHVTCRDGRDRQG